MTTATDEPIVDAEPSDAALAMRRPDIPVTLSELAALKGEALEVIAARVQVLETLHKAAIRATSPDDWLLFKAPDEQGGQIVGYLQDSGCERVRDLYGIEIFDISKPERVLSGTDPKVFHYLITGNGRCKLTRQVVEQIEGGRSSTDDFCRDKQGAELELAVRKAARANLDGRIVRELAGLGSVPIEELGAAWAGTTKKVEHCRKGRGFGTRDERLGATREGEPTVEPPMCPHCKTKGVYRPAKGDRKAFYGCPNFEKHKDQKFIVDAAKWVAEHQPKPAAPTSPAPTPAATSAPLTAGELFGNRGREPGEDDK